MNIRSLIAASLIGLGLGGCVTSNSDDGDLVTAFDEMVFGANESAEPVAQFTRWEEPVRISVRGTLKPEYLNQLNRAIADARALTGHDIAITRNHRAANIVLYFDDGAGYVGYLRSQGVEMDEGRWTGIVNGFCWASVWAQVDRLGLAAIYIGGGEEGLDDTRLRQCVYHELAHALGLVYHPGDTYSILDHVTSADTFTRIDRLLLGLLYDRRLTAGLGRQETLRRARAILGRGGRRR